MADGILLHIVPFSSITWGRPRQTANGRARFQRGVALCGTFIYDEDDVAGPFAPATCADCLEVQREESAEGDHPFGTWDEVRR